VQDLAVPDDGLRVEPPPVALPAKGSDRPRVGNEELRLPPPREQLIHVVGRGRPVPRLKALLVVDAVQEPELGVVHHLVLLTLPERLGGEGRLPLGLVERPVVGVGAPCRTVHDRLCPAELELARSPLVVDEGRGQPRLPRVAGGELDRRLPVLVPRLPPPLL